jgi:hypothetical protein
MAGRKGPARPSHAHSGARRTGSDGLGHENAAKDKPHRLPLADPAVHRSGRDIPVRHAIGGRLRRWQFGATPFDVEETFWSHRGEACTFDVMLEEFGLRSDALDRLAAIVRAADTARLDLAPQAPGLLAASLGFSRMYRDDLTQLDATMGLYDAFYRWARDAAAETHSWPTPSSRRP